MLTKAQIKWALEHDWAIRETADGQSIVVWDVVLNVETNEVIEKQYRWTGSFQDLRIWAGY